MKYIGETHRMKIDGLKSQSICHISTVFIARLLLTIFTIFSPIINTNALSIICGKPIAKLTRRIIGGQDAYFGEFPWQVREMTIKMWNSFEILWSSNFLNSFHHWWCECTVYIFHGRQTAFFLSRRLILRWCNTVILLSILPKFSQMCAVCSLRCDPMDIRLKFVMKSVNYIYHYVTRMILPRNWKARSESLPGQDKRWSCNYKWRLKSERSEEVVVIKIFQLVKKNQRWKDKESQKFDDAFHSVRLRNLFWKIFIVQFSKDNFQDSI